MVGSGYVSRELTRRKGRTLLTALGLALGVGLVMGIVGVSDGLDEAQAEVLAPLTSVGTDILVTRVAGSGSGTSSSSSPGASSPSSVPAGPQRGGGFFGPGAGGPQGALNDADTRALLEENSNVTTDLASLGEPGTPFTRDFFLSATLLSFPDDAVDQIAGLDGVTSAVGGLVQLAQHQTGTVPQIVARLQTGGETVTQTVRPEPMTDAERTTFRQCLADKGVTIQGPDDGPAGGVTVGGPGDAPPNAGGGGDVVTRAQGPPPEFDECLPERFREFRASFTTPTQVIEQVVNPPSTDITNTSYTAAGVDPSRSDVGLVTREQLVDGSWLADGATTDVLLNVAYANSNDLSVGSTLPINGVDYRVVGLVRPTLTGSTADVYFPLATLQDLATKEGRVTQVLVSAASSADVEAVAARIKDLLPGAEVVTTAELADQVSGSLADAGKLIDRLGGVLAVIVLLGAFAIAALLTLSSITKRVREIGTLRAIGWSKGRVVRQLLGETLAIGLLGGVLGVGVGVVVSQAVAAFSPSLTATTMGVPGVGSSDLAGLFGQAVATAQTTTVSLTAPLSASTLLLGVAFAVVGGTLAGLAGAWRAARLTPAVALRNFG